MSFECRLLKMNTTNLKATTKRVTLNNLTKEIKWNHKKYLINPRKGTQKRKTQKRAGRWLTHSNLTVSAN